MADRITITFGAETREVEVAGRKMSDVLKDTEDALEDVGATGEDSLDKVTKSADDATESTDKLGSGVGGELTDAFGKFDGTANGALESVADGLGGLAALIPGVGGLIGAGVGAALTEGVHAFTADLDKQAKESEDRIQSMYDAFIDSGQNYFTEAQKIDAIGKLTADTEKLGQAQKIAADLGVEVQQVILAQVEAGNDRYNIQQLINEQIQAEYQIGRETGEVDSNRIVRLNQIKASFQDLTAEQQKSIEQAEINRAAVELVTGQHIATNEEIQKTNKLLAETPKEIGTKLVVDTSGLDEIERTPRRVRVDLYDQYGRALK